MIGFKHNVQPVARPNGMLPLAYRRHEIRRRRHGLAHGIASGLGWGAALLAAGYFVLSAIVGLANA